MFDIIELLNILSFIILLTCFILVSNKRVNSYIKTFRLQSFFLVLVGAFFGLYEFLEKGKFDGIIYVCLITFLIKVIFIPMQLNKIVKKIGYKVEKDFYFNIPILVIVCSLLVMLIWVVVSELEIKEAYTRIFLVNSISVVIIGLFFMISRKKAIGQIIGLLVIENGIFMGAILTTMGTPMIVELGIFFDLLTSVIVMGILVFRINESFDSINIDKLTRLKG